MLNTSRVICQDIKRLSRFFYRLWRESETKRSDIFLSQGRYAYCDTWTMFTTNYDTCLEHYWRRVARVNLNTGSNVQEATRTWVLNASKLSERTLRLLKMHGSISWLIEFDGTVTEEQSIMGRPLVGRELVGEMMIYPIQQKELYLEPYVSMLKELNYELKRKSNWIIIGYSFNDPIIREIFIRKSDEAKKIVVLHPHAKRVKEEKLANIEGEVFPMHEKFGENDLQFKRVNRDLVSKLKPNLEYSYKDTV